MRNLVALPVILLTVILQSAVISRVYLLSGIADLPMVMLAAWALQEEVDSAWQWEARNIAERMERQAASGRDVRPYTSQAGQPISVAYVNGLARWTLGGQRIARRTALAAIAERMAARLK